MKNFVPLDPDSHVSQEHWAVVYVPRRSRNRFAANCVHVFANQEEALKQSVPKERQFAAKVIGPSKSSEGQSIYYLIHWLNRSP
jgi:hypothetical protein